MTSTKTLLLAGTALLLVTAAASAAPVVANGGGYVLAQAAPPPHEGENEKDKKAPARAPEKGHRPEAQPPHQAPKPGPAAVPQKPAAAPPHEAPKAVQQPLGAPKAAQLPHEVPKAAQQPHDMPKAAQQPLGAPKAAEPQHQAEPRREERRPERPHDNAGKPEAKPEAPASTMTKPAPAPTNKPAAVERKPQPHEAPASATQAKPAAPAARSPAAQAPAPQKPAAQAAPATPTAPNNARIGAPQIGSAPGTAPAAMAPPQKPQSAQQFILPKNGKPTVTMQDVRKERHETREGNRTVITEGNRTIVTQDNRTIIRHNETQRFAVGARDVNVERRGNETTTVIVRPDGDRIINVTDERGHLIRRIRRERDGREIVIIDERSAGPRRGDVFVELPPPVIHIPRDRYIVELDRARPEVVYEVLDAPPVQRMERRYTVDQVRYSAPLRDRMPRIDLDINFDTGSWQLTPGQIDKLSVVAEGLNRAIRRNPREVFLIEGHTDAVGSAEDNLSLSDRRAESVAVALTEQFHVPPENLVTQGYGEQNLKVQTEGAERANRRVSVRRITPLIDQQAAR
jgi:outer membrane protein OmpA-like peptidoglycan-associated protein